MRGGSDEFGRVDFCRVLTALIMVMHPTATEVRADPGRGPGRSGCTAGRACHFLPGSTYASG